MPSDVAVHCAATQEEALDLLVADTASTGVAPRLATVSSGVRLMPDGVLVDGVAVRLTPLEHAMLLCLLSPPGSVWSFLALSQQVWGTSFVGDGAQVRAVLKRLRRKLVAAGADLRIESVRGRGLRLAVGTEALSAPAPQLPHNCPSQVVAEAVVRL